LTIVNKLRILKKRSKGADNMRTETIDSFSKKVRTVFLKTFKTKHKQAVTDERLQEMFKASTFSDLLLFYPEYTLEHTPEYWTRLIVKEVENTLDL